MRPNGPLRVNHRTRSNRDMNVLPVVLALAIAAPLAAQQPDSSSSAPPDSAQRHHTMLRGHRGRGPWRGNQMMERRQWGSMGRDMTFDLAHLLARKDVLALTPQQVTRLTALQQSAEPAFTASRTEIRKQREAIAAIMKADARYSAAEAAPHGAPDRGPQCPLGADQRVHPGPGCPERIPAGARPRVGGRTPGETLRAAALSFVGGYGVRRSPPRRPPLWTRLSTRWDASSRIPRSKPPARFLTL